ncbi:MAG: hypothetical protein HQL76_05700 [Magnetococcales bacterium]|nr:hypothetical protein [Magnetococcales bacterium]
MCFNCLISVFLHGNRDFITRLVPGSKYFPGAAKVQAERSIQRYDCLMGPGRCLGLGQCRKAAKKNGLENGTFPGAVGSGENGE